MLAPNPVTKYHQKYPREFLDPVRLIKTAEQILRWYGKGTCQLHDVFQAYVAFPALNAAYIVAVQLGPFSEGLLGQAKLFSQLADAGAETRLDRGKWHPFIVRL